MKKGDPSIQFTYERTYTLRFPKFKLFKNVEFLDTDKLSRGSHTIELGKFDGCHCDCVITAKVRDGMITGIEYPKCEKSTKIPPKLARKLEAARKELSATHGQTTWKDIPVQELTRSAASRLGIIVVVTTSGDCYEVCIDPGTGLQTCWICCPGWCIGPSDPHVAFF
jgi:hypothetical protein